MKSIRKETLVLALAFLMMASFFVMTANATQRPRLQTIEHMAHPQAKDSKGAMLPGTEIDFHVRRPAYWYAIVIFR
ncbi:hypothetical protein HHK36_028022 [Tetracentron sinense]|uniref:Uncharacterized protein n=1 Tax=Tetracentron sinense TaxID=13715 RepID=A0A834YK94_TETSI|nr:hypothetical protein HHK36_028022 [Tetracentron sinense]